MAVSYQRLFCMLNQKGLKKYFLRQNGINPKVVDALSKNRNVNVSTIMDLCKLLNCQPSDIMEYVPDDETDS
ncbi:MAG: helix-turn-helix transcriptional regulator [Oscillospiraceae bacterium]|nr:helix-turn-helix transcriptional regulator [Oscillospiraceae bacterium]